FFNFSYSPNRFHLRTGSPNRFHLRTGSPNRFHLRTGSPNRFHLRTGSTNRFHFGTGFPPLVETLQYVNSQVLTQDSKKEIEVKC
ncbi:GATA zinc finger domain-containing 14-like, partial [Brachionus plicatilis]